MGTGSENLRVVLVAHTSDEKRKGFVDPIRHIGYPMIEGVFQKWVERLNWYGPVSLPAFPDDGSDDALVIGTWIKDEDLGPWTACVTDADGVWRLQYYFKNAAPAVKMMLRFG
jgi:hypothetical protein